jgi:hypothetical protein
VALEGPVTAQVSVTLPVNELAGVTVMVEVLPVVPPGLRVMFPLLLREKSPLLAYGFCQKFPQPASRSGAAASTHLAHLPIFIAAPFILLQVSMRYVAVSTNFRTLRHDCTQN